MAKASSMRSRTSQLRKAPSFSNDGASQEAAKKQFRTASLASWRLSSTRYATRWRTRRYRENRISNESRFCSRLLLVSSSVPACLGAILVKSAAGGVAGKDRKQHKA